MKPLFNAAGEYVGPGDYGKYATYALSGLGVVMFTLFFIRLFSL